MSRHRLGRRRVIVSVQQPPTRFAGRLDVFRRLSWGVADQGVSSLSNLALGVIAARSLGASGFGAFSLAFVTSAFLLTAVRGVATDPLLVRHSGPPTPVWRAAAAAATATAAVGGVAVGTLCIVAGLVLPAELRGAFIALGVCLPGLLLQDSWRFVFFSTGRPAKAFVNDLVRGAVQLIALFALAVTGRGTVVTCVLVFGGSAAVAAAFGFVQSRVRPRIRSIRSWVLDTKDLGIRYLVENLSSAGATQVIMFVLGAVAGLAAVGHTRGAQILMGPFLVVLMGASSVAIPEAAQVLRNGAQRLQLFCIGLGAAFAIAAAAWGVLILALLPTGLGDLLLGSIWKPASTLLLPVIVTMFLAAFDVAALAGVRALAAARRSLFAQLTSAGLKVTGGTIGAVIDGAWGSCWGVALGTTLGVVVWWVQLRRALREHTGEEPELETSRVRDDRISR